MGEPDDDEIGRLNVPVAKGRLRRWTRQAKAAGYSTLAEYVRRVLDGLEVVVPFKGDP